ncbi:hypothetical protein GS432_06375 [Rhodococcus hoagii]|nr:hypothetical protein [Prescottella equi]
MLRLSTTGHRASYTPRGVKKGSSDADLALIKQIQPVVSGIGTVIGGLGAILSLIGAGGCFQLIRPATGSKPPTRPRTDRGFSSFGGNLAAELDRQKDRATIAMIVARSSEWS